MHIFSECTFKQLMFFHRLQTGNKNHSEKVHILYTIDHDVQCSISIIIHVHCIGYKYTVENLKLSQFGTDFLVAIYYMEVSY